MTSSKDVEVIGVENIGNYIDVSLVADENMELVTKIFKQILSEALKYMENFKHPVR
jgi:hypothetical protein